jgi:hypothetical protein
MQIRVEAKDDGQIEISCCCLKTDSWHDYLAFKQDARDAFVRHDVKAYARYLRAGLLSMFGHTEAVVNEICDKIKPALKRSTLCDRISFVVEEARKVGNVPQIVFALEKNLRDMIAHPGVEKSFGGAKEDYAATYERLDYEALERFEAQLSPWLDAICSALGVVRLEDTEGALKDFSDYMSDLAGSSVQRKMPAGGPV